jgi:branched-chain amino acid transport system permease protein
MVNENEVMITSKQNATSARLSLDKGYVRTLVELAVISVVMMIAARFFRMYRITDFMVFIIFVLSFDLLYGYMGHLSFGHMLYFGSGTYASAIFMNRVSGNPLLGILAGILFAALLALLAGALVMKTHGAAFALINMGFNQIGFFMVVSGLSSITRGDDGMSVFFDPLGSINLGNERVLFYVVLGSLLAVFYFLKRLTQSSFGVMVRSIHENESRVKFLGYNTYRYKIITFVISCAIAGFAGTLTTINYGFISPGFINPFYNVNPIFAILIGGAGNLYGAIIGGLVFKFLSEYIAIYVSTWELYLGIALLIMTFRFRTGIVGAVSSLMEKLMKRHTGGGTK